MVESFFQPLRGKSSSPAVHEDALTNAVNTGSSLVVFKEKQPSGSQPAKFNTQARPKAPAGYGFVSFGADEPSIPFACVEPQLFAGKDAPAKIRKLLGPGGWHLPPPSLLLSFTGAEDGEALDLSAPAEAALTLGLGKVAQRANAWIVSGGLDQGASGLVGRAMAALAAACTDGEPTLL